MANFRSSADLEVLRKRAELLRMTRAFFDERGFIEVQTPVLSADTVIDRHLDPIPVLLPPDGHDPSQGRSMWLQTSPEFAMKRLLASGAETIYQIGPAFRVGELGSQHNPEFTIAEWYRVGDDMPAAITLLGQLVCKLLALPPARTLAMDETFRAHRRFRSDAAHCPGATAALRSLEHCNSRFRSAR